MKLKSNINEIQVSYKSKEVKRMKIGSSMIAVEQLRPIFPVDLDHREAMVALFLNRANNVISYATISIGGVASTVCDPKMIFQYALAANACSLILCHNHPSGNLEPSKSDIALTKMVKSGGEFLELPLLDHIIITSDSYYSFADEGMM